ncbi:hypothetical protein BC831DRAFT_476868 [Entophlyctis helioformis]|nr:hypothetical protein BC831DRAFT_476868 [Entophlyctis helioformis]
MALVPLPRSQSEQLPRRQPGLLDIPSEVLGQILQDADFADALVLRSVCRRLHHTVRASSPAWFLHFDSLAAFQAALADHRIRFLRRPRAREFEVPMLWTQCLLGVSPKCSRTGRPMLPPRNLDACLITVGRVGRLLLGLRPFPVFCGPPHTANVVERPDLFRVTVKSAVEMDLAVAAGLDAISAAGIGTFSVLADGLGAAARRDSGLDTPDTLDMSDAAQVPALVRGSPAVSGVPSPMSTSLTASPQSGSPMSMSPLPPHNVIHVIHAGGTVHGGYDPTAVAAGRPPVGQTGPQHSRTLFSPTAAGNTLPAASTSSRHLSRREIQQSLVYAQLKAGCKLQRHADGYVGIAFPEAGAETEHGYLLRRTANADPTAGQDTPTAVNTAAGSPALGEQGRDGKGGMPAGPWTNPGWPGPAHWQTYSLATRSSPDGRAGGEPYIKFVGAEAGVASFDLSVFTAKDVCAYQAVLARRWADLYSPFFGEEQP